MKHLLNSMLASFVFITSSPSASNADLVFLSVDVFAVTTRGGAETPKTTTAAAAAFCNAHWSLPDIPSLNFYPFPSSDSDSEGEVDVNVGVGVSAGAKCGPFLFDIPMGRYDCSGSAWAGSLLYGPGDSLLPGGGTLGFMTYIGTLPVDLNSPWEEWAISKIIYPAGIATATVMSSSTWDRPDWIDSWRVVVALYTGSNWAGPSPSPAVMRQPAAMGPTGLGLLLSPSMDPSNREAPKFQGLVVRRRPAGSLVGADSMVVGLLHGNNATQLIGTGIVEDALTETQLPPNELVGPLVVEVAFVNVQPGAFDLDGDGRFTALDFSHAESFIGTVVVRPPFWDPITNNGAIKQWDLDGDGVISILDLDLIASLLNNGIGYGIAGDLDGDLDADRLDMVIFPMLGIEFGMTGYSLGADVDLNSIVTLADRDGAVAAMWSRSCVADYSADGFVNLDDLGDFVTDFYLPEPPFWLDVDGNGFINLDDLGDYISLFYAASSGAC